MDDLTLPQVAKKLEKYVMTLPVAKNFNKLGTEPRKAMVGLSDAVFQLRLNTERYFGADDSSEQAVFLEEALIQVEKANNAVLNASNHDLIGPADTAHLSALAEDIRERLS